MRPIHTVLLALATACAGAAKDDVDDTDTDVADTDVADTDVTDTDVTDDTDCVVDACGTCDDDPSNDCVTSWSEVSGAWTCPSPDSCGDRYGFTVPDDTTLTVTVFGITGSSVVRLALREDSVDGGTNLINSAATYHMCNMQDETVEVMVLVADAGTYTLSVVRDWGDSSGEAGTYSVGVDASPGVVFEGRTADDDVSTTTGTCNL